MDKIEGFESNSASMWSLDRVPIQVFVEVLLRLSPLEQRMQCARLGRRYYHALCRLRAGPLPIEFHCTQGKPYWHSLRKLYGLISGSNSSARCGLSRYEYPATAAMSVLDLLPPDGPPEPGDERRDPWAAAKVGAEREPVHARNFALAILPRRYRALYEVGFYRHPTIDWISTSPDRLLPLHPSSPLAAVELKEKMYGLPTRPMPEHLVQVSQQMEVLGVPWIFLSYQTLDGMAVFLVERSEAFWRWAMRRFRRFHDCVHRTWPDGMLSAVPSDGFVVRGVELRDGRQFDVDIEWMGAAVEALWDSGVVEPWLRRRFTPFEVPPEPPWRLVAYRPALDKQHSNYDYAPRESSRQRTVRPETIVAAIGALFDTDSAGEAIRRVRAHAAGLLSAAPTPSAPVFVAPPERER